jgi:hypothetical protein
LLGKWLSRATWPPHPLDAEPRDQPVDQQRQLELAGRSPSKASCAAPSGSPQRAIS